jgi:hypothetical protein
MKRFHKPKAFAFFYNSTISNIGLLWVVTGTTAAFYIIAFSIGKISSFMKSLTL